MPIYEVTVPRSDPRYRVTLAFVEGYTKPHAGESSLVYLNRVRLFPAIVRGSELEQRYNADLPQHRRAFRALLATIDATMIVGTPSSRPFVLDYLAEAQALFPEAVDLTSLFTKAQSQSGGRAESLASFLPAIAFDAAGLGDVCDGNILIIDDVIANGTTAAAVIARLDKAGLVADRRIVIAAPLCGTRAGPIPPADTV